ncbi:MAG TPA: hypothetical protein VFB67_09825 [Candidatus Polarisedimenticolaceae bacterium]|nr:hypothetical protein [Candidatus Polarisedimenticolaceae bacterium]
MRRRLSLAAAVLAAACASPHPERAAPRPITDAARGVRYVVPAGWSSFDGEIRSPSGSLLTLRVYDLVEADKEFVAGLPDTLIPQLEEWAKYYYIVDGGPRRASTTIASLPATELEYPIRVRRSDPPSKVTYWVVTRKTRLFVLRAAYPASGLASDEPVMRRVLDGWQFLETPPGPG